MAVYTFRPVPAWGAVGQFARVGAQKNKTFPCTLPGGGDATVVQGGTTKVGYVESDDTGMVPSFTTTDIPRVICDFGFGAVSILSEEYADAVASFGVSEDAAIAAAVTPGAGTATDAVLAATYETQAAATASLAGKADKPKPGKNALTGWFHADGYGLSPANTASANDTALSDALADMRSGDTLYIPPAATEYLFTTFTPTKAIHIKGGGASHVRNQQAFGFANWTNGTAISSGLVTGTILRSTATSGSAIFIDNDGDLNHSAISDLVLIGPGSGTSIGITVGDPTSAIGYPVRTRLRNVTVANFATGIDSTCENATWDGLYIVGCSTGLSTHYPFNGNTINGLNIELSSVRALSMVASDGNVFNGGVIQGHSAGPAIYMAGCWSNRLHFYVEGTAASGPQDDVYLTTDSGGTGLACSDNVISGFWATHSSAVPRFKIDANSVRNEFRGSGPHASVAYTVTNAGAYNVFNMNLAGAVTDTGRNNAYRDNNFSGGTFLPFQQINGSASMLVDDSLWIITAVSTATITIPDPTVVRKGKVLRVKNGTTLTTHIVVSAGTSKTIDGAASVAMAAWQARSFVSDGTQWLTV